MWESPLNSYVCLLTQSAWTRENIIVVDDVVRNVGWDQMVGILGIVARSGGGLEC